MLFRSRDPFFDKPYEASERHEPAVWEKGSAASPSAGRVSPSIRPKRKVAALLGGGKA